MSKILEPSSAAQTKAKREQAIGYVAAVAVVLLGWAVLSALLKSPALPSPWSAFAVFGQEWKALVPHVGISLWRIVASMIIGTALALPLGLWAGRSRRADTVVAPILYLLYPIPKVVFLPVLMVLLGLGNAPKIVLIATVIFFQTAITARDSAKAIPSASVMSVKSLGATQWQIVRHVVLPASLPSVFTALRINTGTAIAILFLSESIAGTSGVGYYIVNAWGMINYASMFAGIIAMALLGVVLYEALNLIEARLTRWKRAA